MSSVTAAESVNPLFKRVGLLIGAATFFLILFAPTPHGLSIEGQRVLAAATLMAIWWITEAIPIPATSLAPLALFPLLGIMDGKELASSYGDSNIFLFAGGFFIAIAMQKWKLQERIALHIILRTGATPGRLVLGIMIATAFISMWVSNTATTMMMLPIGIAVIEQLGTHQQSDTKNFGMAVALGIAYAASIGGTGTLVGTPPNIVMTGMMSRLYPDAPKIGFAQWMLYGTPFVILFVPVAWLLLTRVLFPLGKTENEEAGREALEARLAGLGPMNRGEITVFIVSLLTVFCWIFREDLDLGSFVIPGWTRILAHPKYVNDGTVAVAFALLLFFTPINIRKGEFVLDWEWAQKIPWGVLLLFGGGFAIAKGFSDSGLVQWFGGYLGVLRGASPLVMVLVVAAAITFLTEIMSNTALAMIALPILAATATSALHVNPLLLVLPATVSASLAFMLPVGTPPNALVYASGYVTIPQMARAGLVLNVVGILIVTAVTYFIAIPLNGIVAGQLPPWAH